MVGSSPTKRTRVLVVDDIPQTIDHVVRLLGFEATVEVVGTARTADDAVELATVLARDVVLLAIMMPGTDGIAGARAIKAVTRDVRIVIMSIQDGASYLSRALAAGVSDYLVKPFSGEELVSSIHGLDAPKGDRSARGSQLVPSTTSPGGDVAKERGASDGIAEERR